MVRDLVITEILKECGEVTIVLIKECGKDHRFKCKISKRLLVEPKAGMKVKGVLKFDICERQNKKGNITYLQHAELIPISNFEYEKCKLKIKRILNRSEKYQYLLVINKRTNNEFVARMLIDEVEGLKGGYVMNCEMYFSILQENNLNGDSRHYQLVLAKRLFKNNEEENEGNEKDRTND